MQSPSAILRPARLSEASDTMSSSPSLGLVFGSVGLQGLGVKGLGGLGVKGFGVEGV